MAVGKGAHQLETLTCDEQRLSRKHVAQRFHQLSREMGEVRKRLVAHGFADAHRTAQQVSLVGALGTVCPDVVATCRRDVHRSTTSWHSIILHRLHPGRRRLVAHCYHGSPPSLHFKRGDRRYAQG